MYIPRRAREINQNKMLKAIEHHGSITFTELLKSGIVSREPLSRHLRKLVSANVIEKHFDKTRNRVVYRLTRRAVAEFHVEGMIRHVGLYATYHVVRTKLNLPSDFDFNKEINIYLNEELKLPWKELLQYLEKNHKLLSFEEMDEEIRKIERS